MWKGSGGLGGSGGMKKEKREDCEIWPLKLILVLSESN